MAEYRNWLQSLELFECWYILMSVQQLTVEYLATHQPTGVLTRLPDWQPSNCSLIASRGNRVASPPKLQPDLKLATPNFSFNGYRKFCFWGQNGSELELPTRLHPVSKIRMNGAVPPLLLCTLLSWKTMSLSLRKRNKYDVNVSFRTFRARHSRTSCAPDNMF